ncbi:LysM peptidoglycan-binding domain-containing protein [Anaerobranca gottschalkii]|uniref:LysM domain-containing protein n=1 Tax=Anaerobranca gottschalkii DSM 13577 TaxID=1120990 RepID=A0A1I0BZ65_9FIRM|nr:LysM domain-containing protein [Anaerobranca gottschalkii]SET12498.1 LysM domain-containing protein [Anaerobranca gottschalkii DSM 13577]
MKGLKKAQKSNGGKMPVPQGCSGKLHIITKEESLFIIAKKYKVPLNRLIEMNGQIKDPDIIYEGQIICVPTREDKDKRRQEYTEVVLNSTGKVANASGVAFIRKTTNDLVVFTANLPHPRELFPNGESYTAYLLDSATGNYDKFNLKKVQDFWVGQVKDKPLRKYDGIIIAPNTVSGNLLPGEPVVLEGIIY